MKDIFEQLINTNIRPFLPAHAMLKVIRSEEVYEDLIEEMEEGNIRQKDIENFVDKLFDEFKKGVAFRYNEALSILAVSINDADTDFEDGFCVKELAELESMELGAPSRIAEACIQESSSN